MFGVGCSMMFDVRYSEFDVFYLLGWLGDGRGSTGDLPLPAKQAISLRGKGVWMGN